METQPDSNLASGCVRFPACGEHKITVLLWYSPSWRQRGLTFAGGSLMLFVVLRDKLD